MQKLLITGSTGFIGSQILQNLRKSYLIFIITRDKKKKLKMKMLLWLISVIIMNWIAN